MRYLLSLFFLSISVFGFDYHLKSYTMTKGVECFFGLSSQVNKTNGGNIINSCYIESDEGYIVIDSGPTYSYAQQAYSLISKRKKLPVKYVINTSADQLHILGNGFYKEQGAILLGPTSYSTKIHISLDKQITTDALTNTRLTPLDKTIKNREYITLGKLKILVKRAIKGDDHYLTVHIPSKEIIFVGDMVFNNQIPAIEHGRSLEKWLDALKKIEKTPWKRIISSHGIKTKRSALKNTKSYLTMLKDEVQSSIQRGTNKKNTIKETQLFSFQDDRLYEKWHSKNVAVAYDQLQHTKPQKAIKKIKKKIDKKSKKKIVKKKKPKRKKVAKIPYYSYNRAIRLAKKQKKIVLLKIRSDNCPFCDELDRTIAKSQKIKRIINRNYKVVYLNNSRDSLPLGIEVDVTPSLAFIRPDTQEVVMITPGIEAIGELITVLNEAASDGKNLGYLR
jgi:glyoxylase-like metal-dependent hydrolase (beta-lactamase superfamily II)